MPDRPPIPLSPLAIEINSEEFLAIAGWPYADPFVSRLLRDDIPLRTTRGNCRVWVYRDPAGSMVGFGTLDVSREYSDFSSDRPHPYIPLLAINPTIKSMGYGESIVRHLVAESALLARTPELCCDLLFLDVYTSSTRAIELYRRCEFVTLNDSPIIDGQEGDQGYWVMARRVSVAKPS